MNKYFKRLVDTYSIDEDLDPNDVDVSLVENHLVFRIARYGFENPVFTLNELSTSLSLSSEDRDVMISYVNSSLDANPSKMIISVNPSIFGAINHDGGHRLTPEALFAFMDYIELKQSREHSRRASRQSRQAVKISMLALVTTFALGLIQILIGLLAIIFT